MEGQTGQGVWREEGRRTRQRRQRKLIRLESLSIVLISRLPVVPIKQYQQTPPRRKPGDALAYPGARAFYQVSNTPSARPTRRHLHAASLGGWGLASGFPFSGGGSCATKTLGGRSVYWAIPRDFPPVSTVSATSTPFPPPQQQRVR